MESESLRSGTLNFWKMQGAQKVTFLILSLSSQIHFWSQLWPGGHFDGCSNANLNHWNLEPWISGKCRALGECHFQYLTFLRKCTFGANGDQGVILMDVQSASLKCKAESLTLKLQIWTRILTNHSLFIGNFKISMIIYESQLFPKQSLRWGVLTVL